jgi:hypothetical protein
VDYGNLKNHQVFFLRRIIVFVMKLLQVPPDDRLFPVEYDLTYEKFLYNFSSLAQKQAEYNFNHFWKVWNFLFFSANVCN